MADSDIDNWYDWKGGSDSSKMSHRKDSDTSMDIGLFNSSHLDHLTHDNSQRGNSRINGLHHYRTMPASSRSGPEVRFINPAIYSQSLDKGDEEQEIQIRVKIDSEGDIDDRRCNGQIEANCGDSSEMSDLLSTLSLKNDLAGSDVGHAGDQASAQETYRCYSLTSPVTNSSAECTLVRSKSVISSRPTTRVEKRCRIDDELGNKEDPCSSRQTEPEVQRYTSNGHRVVQISATSLSSSSLLEGRMNGVDLARKIAHDEWIRKKQQAAQRKKEEEDLIERERQEEAQRLAREKEERENRERESFLKWSEKKKKEEERKKAAVERELELERRLKEIEDKAAVAKSLCLRQWARKKKEEEKARQRKQEIKQKKVDEDRKKRLEDSTKAYEKWRVMSKNKPKPATQGLLPHQKAKPAYVNPTPWQQTVDEPDDVQEEASNIRKTQSQSKISWRKNTMPYQ